MEAFKKTPLALFITGTLITSMPLLLQAETIIYDGSDLGMLDNELWVTPWSPVKSLFPKVDLSNNQVTVSDGVIEGYVFGGVTGGNQEIINNSIIIEGGTVGESVYGGWSREGNVSNNSISIVGGTVEKFAYGGSSNEGNASSNSIYIDGGTVKYSVYGGRSNAYANDNSITINNGSVASAYGGYTYYTDNSIASGNRVTINGGSVKNAYGGYSDGGTANDNHTVINGGSVINAYGGFTSGGYLRDASASNNSLTINDGIVENAYGGASPWSDTIGNRIIIKGGTVEKNAYGGYSGSNTDESNAYKNSMFIEGGTVKESAYGGYSYYGNASNNSITIKGGSVEQSAYGGYSYHRNVTGNSMFIEGGVVKQNVYGGYSELGNINNNIAIISGAIEKNAYGGYSGSYTDENNVYKNSIAIEGGTVKESAYGGYSHYGNAKENSISIKDGTVEKNAYGGYSGYYSVSNTYESGAYKNSISIEGGTVKESAYGGYSHYGNANENSISIKDGSVEKSAYGGYSDYYGDVTDNSMSIEGGSVKESAYGGYSYSGNAYNNRMIIKGGTVEDNAIGGFGGYYSNATGNSVIITDGAVVKNTYGGYSNSGNANNNSASITNDGSVVNAYGGYSNYGYEYGDYRSEGNANGNNVTIDGGSIGNAFGGWSYFGNATINTVTLSGDTQFTGANSALYGGYTENINSGNVFSGNTLNFSAQPINVGTVANFEYYNFTLNPEYANTTTSLITAENIELGADANTPSKVQVVGIQSGKALSAKDSFILMQATNSMNGYGQGMTSTGIAQQGISVLYDVKTTVDIEGKVVIATILGDGPEPEPETEPTPAPGIGTPAGRVNPQLKALSEGYLAGAMLINRGADAVAFDAFDAINAQNNQSGVEPFVMLSASRTRYSSGSHVKSNDVVLTSGLSYQNKNVTSAVFLETGRGSYDSYNSFANAAKVHGSGNTRYYGAGILGRYKFDNNTYTDVSVRAGNSRTKFDTSDIKNLATGESAKYNLRSNYISAHIGAGYVMSLDEKNTLDLSAKYLHSSVDGSKVDIAGDSIEFKRVDSQRVRVNAVLNHAYSETLSLNAGIGYEHEFGSKAKATALSTHNIEAPDVKGGTGIFSVGVNVKPSTYKNLSFDFNADAYTGKREGIGASIRAGYAF